MNTIQVGDVQATREQIQEGITWCDEHPGSEHDTFKNGMKALKNPLAKWSEHRVYTGLRPHARKPEIRAHLSEKLDEAAETGGRKRPEWLRQLATRTLTVVLRSAATRRAVLVRSGGRCENPRCTTPGGRVADVTMNGDPILQVDHIIDLGREGEDIASNMIVLCPNCHAMKTLGSTRETLRREFAAIAARHAA